MSPTVHGLPAVLRTLPAALAAIALPVAAWAQPIGVPARDSNAALYAGLALAGVLVVFLCGAWLLLRRLAAELQDQPSGTATASTLSGRLLDLPLGVPEGSVRALLSVFIIVFGFLLLALQGPLGLGAGEALTGFIGSVISFYFASRSGEQSRQLVEGAREAVRDAANVASRAAASMARTAGHAAPTPEQQSRLATLREVQAKLQSLRGLVAVAGTLGVGAGAVAGADRALARMDGLLTRITPVLDGQADAETLGRLAEEVSGALRELGDLGPVGNAVADAMATIGHAAAESGPISRLLGALFGGTALAGPAGLVAAVLTGGLALVRDREKFERWKAAMLDTPLDLGLLPPTVDANLAATALLRAPLLARHLAPGGTMEPALALAVWEAIGITNGQAPEPARSLAGRILDGAPGDGAAVLRRAFAGNPAALTEAIEDFRAAMTGAAALAGLDLPRLSLGGAEIPTEALGTAVRVARQDGRVATELERMVYLVEAVGKADPATFAEAAQRLGSTEFLQGAAAQAAAKQRSADQASAAAPQQAG